ncbi:unnamed protein product [Meloidogyne enterolobii]|uniref:Uncharacterized protein n=1 Tax=Meloidogyne enterolobii TaxID=390850 RepID=A0ACB0XPS4_MELEN
MPIISSQFPEQNVAFNVNEFTKNIILREIKKDSDNFKNAKHLNKEFWQNKIFKKINLKLIYKHFILVICTEINENNYFGNFKCGLLKTKLRLIFKDWAEKIKNGKINLKEYHSISGFERERKCKRINGIDEHWTVWLVGINLENNEENIDKQKELLLTINEHFWKINKKENWLNAIYVNQNNLKNMWVYLRDY